MATVVALLRSVATKRAPRPPLGRGLHGGVPSGAGGSLTPPTSNEMNQQGMGRVAAASKVARAQPPHPNPGASSFTPPPTIDKDLIIEDRLSIACTAAGIGATTITGTVVYMYFWVRPGVEAHSKTMMSSGHGKHNGATGKGISVEELAESIKDIRAKVEEQASQEAALRKESEAALAKLEAAVESLCSKLEGECS